MNAENAPATWWTSPPSNYQADRPGAELGDHLSEGNIAVSEAGEGVLYIIGIDVKYR